MLSEKGLVSVFLILYLLITLSGFVFAEEKITIEPDGDDTIQMTVPIKDGDVTFNFLYANATGEFKGIGKDATEQLATTTNDTLTFLEKDASANDVHEYFFASWSDGKNAESYLLRAKIRYNQVTIDKREESGWATVCEYRVIGDICGIGNVNLTISDLGEIWGGAENVTFTAGTNVKFDVIYTKEGLKIWLPVAGVGTEKGIINFSNQVSQIGHDYNSFYLFMASEDDAGNIGEGNEFNFTINDNLDGNLEVWHVNNEIEGGPKGIEIDDSGIYEAYILEKVPIKILHFTNSDEDYVEIFYNLEPPVSPLEIEVIWPLTGYYYITDFLILEIITNNLATCDYNFEGKGFEKMEFTDHINHFHTLFDLQHNMQSNEGYVIDFRCIDLASSEASASTDFKINTSELNKYLIRQDIGGFEYLAADINYPGPDWEFLLRYNAYYENQVASLFDNKMVLIFEDQDAIQGYINNRVIPNAENLSIEIFDNQNVYVLYEEGIEYFMWPSSNYFIINILFFPENNTGELETPIEVILAYLEKYPSDLRDGVCGDGYTDIFNLDGVKEECDGDIEIKSCGSDIGECSIGESERQCNNDCTWGEWSVCNDIGPVDELCDNLDNDCDNSIDEDFTNLGSSCALALGICEAYGNYMCSLDGLTTECSAIPKDPEIEDCTDGLDNDCDGLTDLDDIEDCKPLTINSPRDQDIYSERRILFDIELSYEADELIYTYFDSRGRERERRLCRNCEYYNRSKSFRDGEHNLSIKAIKDDLVFEEEKISFFVDSKSPRISRTEPRRRKFTNGSDFYVKYTEDNCVSLSYSILGQSIGAGGGGSCESGRNIEKYSSMDLSGFDSQTIDYTVTIEDIAGNTDSETVKEVIVDTTPPKINNNDTFYTFDSRYIYFDINISEVNFDEATLQYDYRGRTRESRLCSRLRDGICEKRFRYRDGYENIFLIIFDEAGNSDVQEVLNLII